MKLLSRLILRYQEITSWGFVPLILWRTPMILGLGKCFNEFIDQKKVKKNHLLSTDDPSIRYGKGYSSKSKNFSLKE